MTNAFIAGTVVAILAGVVGYFVVLRRLGFACEALSHGGFAGATGAVVLGQDVFLGLLVFTSVTGGFMGLLGDRIRGRDVAIGGTLAFSLALGSLFLTISTRFAGQAVNILFGNVLAISSSDLAFVAVFAVLALLLIGALYRPLLFASVDAEIADARGVPVRFLSVAFMVLLAITVSASVQVVGVLLIFALLILPAAAAQHITAQPSHAIALAVVLAVVYVWVGLLVGFYLPYPPSFFITALAFVSFVAVRGLLTGVAGGRRSPSPR
jgi:zinc/manganese transport system permease protein